MASFIVAKKTFDLSASADAHVLVSNLHLDLQSSSSPQAKILKKHIDFTATVSFDSAGGSACASLTYVLGQQYSDLPTPTKIQCVFLGWKDANGSYIADSSTVELSCTSLTAQWEEVNIAEDCTSYLAVATSSYKSTGIYSASRYSSLSAVYVDWGDGSVAKVDGSISLFTHTYASTGSYTVKVSNNITDFAASSNDSTWYSSKSLNLYTFKNITKVGSRLASIPSYAFYTCLGLSSINWLSSFSGMSQVPSYCFYNCSSIPSLSALSSTSFKTTASYAFLYCTGLKNLAGIENFTSFGSSTFLYCSGLSAIDLLSATSIRTLPSYCFANCSGLKSIAGAKLITTIGLYCFNSCTGLTGIIDMTDFAYTSLVNNLVFRGCSNVKEFKLPANFSGTYLGNFMFYGCSQLSSITLPSTLTSIADNDFSYCSNLKHIDIPNGVKTIAGSAFRYSGLSSISLPSTLTSITGNYSFANCTSLKSIDIPDSVTTIANYTFYYDSALTSIHLPDSLTSLTSYVLQGCYSLGELAIPSAVTSIGTYALAGCYRLSVIDEYRSTAPSVASTYAFGYSASSNLYSGYTGYSTRGSNKLNVPAGATGYSSGAWSSPLQNASYCGFTLGTLDMRSDIDLGD